MLKLDVVVSSIDENVIEALRDIQSSNAATEIASVAAVFSAIAAIGSVLFIMKGKSYENLIKHRLESLDFIREKFSKITYHFSIETIDKMKKEDCSREEYEAYFIKAKCDLKMQMKVFYDQERMLFELIDEIYLLAQEYFDRQRQKERETLRKALVHLDKEYAIYDWALWQYHQKLHRHVHNHTKAFNKIYKKVREEVERIEFERCERSEILSKMREEKDDKEYTITQLSKLCDGKFKYRKRLTYMKILGQVTNTEKSKWKRLVSPKYKIVPESWKK